MDTAVFGTGDWTTLFREWIKDGVLNAAEAFHRLRTVSVVNGLNRGDTAGSDVEDEANRGLLFGGWTRGRRRGVFDIEAPSLSVDNSVAGCTVLVAVGERMDVEV